MGKAPTQENGQTHSICRQKPNNCLSVFEQFVELTLEKLNDIFEYPDSNLIKLQYPFQIHVINSVTLRILRFRNH